MSSPCKPYEPLLGSYVDGELSPAQAGPLRRHLLDCPACRRQVAGDKALSRWFVRPQAPPVPDGFAARVARRAFAGDPGLEAPAAQAAETPILRFVLRSTAAAAAALLLLAAGIRGVAVPTGGELGADDRVPMKLEQVLSELEALEQRERALEATPVSTAAEDDARGLRTPARETTER